MGAHEIAKGLEVWTLQTLINVSIMLGYFALGLAIAHPYFISLKQKLSLKVSIELWDVLFTLLTDFILAIVVLTGFMVFNTDIMADIKIAVPFVPLGTVLFSIALVIRIFYGGHNVNNSQFKTALWLMFLAVVIQTIGFSLIMEAPSGEYLASHPSEFWTFIKTRLRSNADPYGLELAQYTFYILFPVLMAVFVAGFLRAVKLIQTDNDK